jgi:inner membrane protein
MANGGTHMVVGGGLVLALYIIDQKLIKKEDLSFEGIVGSFALGAVGGAMADWLEPAFHNPNHRQFFHSVIPAALVFLGKDKLYELLQLDEQGKKAFDWFLGAYGSHLALDFATKKGLPVLGTK